MSQSRLFCGFTATVPLLEAIEQCDTYTRSLFLNGSESYLTQLQLGNEIWIGKFLTPPFPLANLETTSANIESLTKRLVPTFQLSQMEVRAIYVPS